VRDCGGADNESILGPKFGSHNLEVMPMDFVRLDSEQLRSFNEDGFLVVKKVLDRAQVDRLIEAGACRQG
jgi:hypothetical protein